MQTATSDPVASGSKLQISQKIQFSDFTKTLEKISTASSAKKIKILEKFIADYKKLVQHLKNQDPNAETSFFPILRLLLPKADRERDAYGIKVPTMAKLYVKVLGIDAKSEEAKALTATNYDDYSTVVYELMMKRAGQVCSLSVWDVNNHLDAMVEGNQNNSRKKIEDELIKLISKLTALDQKWLIRIILKDLRMGLGQARIFSAYHPLAKDFYARQAHLSSVCKSVESGETLPIDESFMEVTPFQPVRPMLCQRINYKLIDPLIADKSHYLETKFDGERFQLHMKDEEYKYFSRNSYDYTGVFGSDFKSGSLTPRLPRLFKKKINSIILDGEMMVWNLTDKVYCTKAENYDAKSLKGDPNLCAEFCAYDILYFNGKSLIGVPYEERTRLLGTLFDDHPGVLTMSKRTQVTDNNQFQDLLNAALDAKEEGVVLKAEDSIYKAGDRNSGWYKIKPDYIDGFICDFDLLIIGGYYSRKRTYISNFLMGVMVSPEKFYSVVRVSIGLTKVESRSLNKSLKPHWNEVAFTKIGNRKMFEMPPCIEWTDKDAPDVWIEPMNSIVLTLKASELVKSSNYRTENTLRFPRITAIRSDKPWLECMTLDEFNKMCESTSKVTKLTTRHVHSGDMAGSVVKPPPKRLRKRPATISFKLLEDEKEDGPQIDTSCAGLDFCVVSTSKGKDYPSMAVLKKMVLRRGGNIVQNPGPTTHAVIAGGKSFLVQKMIESKKYDIVSVDWAIRALGTNLPQKSLMPFHPHDMLATTYDTGEKLAQIYDEYGDGYVEKTTPNELKRIFERMDADELPVQSHQEMVELEDEIYGKNKSPNIFRSMVAFFVEYATSDVSEYQFANSVFRSKGGRIAKSLNDEDLTHIVVDRNEYFSKICSVTNSQAKIVDFRFILRSSDSSQVLDDTEYLISPLGAY